MNNNDATIAKMRELRLHGMTATYKQILETGMNEKYTLDELLTHLVDAEWFDRRQRKQERLRKAAGFRYHATFEELDFTLDRNLDKNQMLRLSNPKWIQQYKDILITGPTGVGKSFIGSALGHMACDHGYKVHYQLTGRMLAELRETKKSGTYTKKLSKLYKTDVLILEDFGLNTFDHESRLILLDIMEDRHGRKSTIFLSQLPVTSWHGIIGDSTIADAIMDRIVYGSYRIELTGDSVRKKKYRDS